MRIEMISHDKKKFLNLLLLADEQENMIDRYLERGEMFVLHDNDVKSICVVTDEGNGKCEIKNIATDERHQGKGYGKKLIEYVVQYYKGKYEAVYVGTGDRSRALGFYEHCGFRKSHCVPHFFIDHYDHPIYEDGKQLVDMVYLKMDIKSN